MPTAAKPNFSVKNAVVMVGDLNKVGGTLDLLCCAREVSFAQNATVEDVVCNPTVGLADQIYHTPTLTITLEEANMDQTILQRIFNMSAATGAAGYMWVGKTNDPNVTPTALSEVDGPHVVTYVTHEAVITLNNGMVLDDSVVVWTRDATTGIFSLAADVTVDYADADTNLATGEIHIDSAALDPSPLYFTYKHRPYTPGSILLTNDWSATFASDVFLRIMHEHANGEDLIIYDIWRARAKPDITISLASVTGDRLVTVPLVFTAFADKRYHPESPLFGITVDTIGRTVTPDYTCDGGAQTISYS